MTPDAVRFDDFQQWYVSQPVPSGLHHRSNASGDVVYLDNYFVDHDTFAILIGVQRDARISSEQFDLSDTGDELVLDRHKLDERFVRHGCYSPRRTAGAHSRASGLREYSLTHREELARSFDAAALPQKYRCSELKQVLVHIRESAHLQRTSTTQPVTAASSASAANAPASLSPQPPNEAGAISSELLSRAGQAVASVSCAEHVDAAATATTLSRMKKARTFDARTSIAITDSSYSIAA
jgi:hypothetical protein